MGSYSGTRKETLALATFVKLLRATHSLSNRVHTHLTDARLTQSQFGVLEALLHLGPLKQVDLGRKILRSSGNMTTVLDNLEKRRLVRRVRNTTDRRQILVKLTPKGDTLIRKIFPGHAQCVAEALSALTAAEQKELGALCRKLGLKLDQG